MDNAIEPQKTTRLTTVYDQREDGWRKIRTEEVEVECAPQTQSLRELRRSHRTPPTTESK